MALVFGAAIALLVGVSAFSYRGKQRLLDEARLSRHTQEVIAQVREVLALLTDVETAQRGFALTADERFLEPYDRARTKQPKELARLRSLTANNPHQQRRLDRLETLHDEKLQYVAQIIDLRRSQGLVAAAQRVGLLQGKDIMDEARAVLADMEAEEKHLQDERERRVESAGRALNRTLLSLSATGLALLALAFYALARENAGRARAEAGLYQFNAHLEKRVRERTVEVQTVNQQLRHDISQRKRLELALHNAELRARATLDAMLEGCQIIGYDWRYLYVNDVVAEQGRQTKEALIGRTMMEAYPGIENTVVFASLRRCMEQRAPERMETEFAFADGSTSWFELSIEPVPEGLFVLSIDITERRRAEAEVERHRQRNEVLLNSAGEGIYGLDLEGRVTFINPKGASILGYGVDELTGVPMHATCHHTHADGAPFPPDECPINAAFTEGRVLASNDDVMWRKDGGVVPVDFVSTPLRDERGKLTGAVVVFQDITERRRLEGMVLQSQKLDAIGRLAGGVAHDFNNLLGVITGYGQLMRQQLEASHPALPRLEQVLKAADRAAGLTRQLLAFSRKQIIQPRVLNLNEVVADLSKMLHRVVGEDLELEIRQAPGLGAVKADPTQIEQVVVNLVVNARDAMPKGGHLTIETANVDLDEAYVASHPEARVGRYVMVSVSDNGVGMDAETQRRIFEPFFTTKPPGEGTGLGLSTVYGVVKQSGGNVWVYSEPGRGTTFKIYLPRVDEEPEALEAERAPAELARGHETLLVVEDTESLREMIREVLEEQGYRLLLASQGEEALALEQEYAGPIHLLLTDLVMPKMGGADLAKKLASPRPDMRVLYMSGYTEGVISRQGVLPQGTALLEKPFTNGRLTRAVREALDTPKPA